jgi:hypothetical protein
MWFEGTYTIARRGNVYDGERRKTSPAPVFGRRVIQGKESKDSALSSIAHLFLGTINQDAAS